jgi:uncharacterized ion transporter superfamily protein YfcC
LKKKNSTNFFKKWITETPNSLVIIFSFILLAMVLTYLVPAGEYDRTVNTSGQEVVIADSFHYVERSPVSPFKMMTAIVQAFTDNAELIFCILFAYCFFGVLTRIGIFETLILILIRKMKSRVSLVLPVITLVFGLMGSIAGMAEETFGLFPVCISLAIALGYDEIVGGSIVYLAVFTGFASATLNPYTVGIAQTIAEVPLYSGLAFRILCFVIFMSVLIIYTMVYAEKIRKNPEKSLMYDPAKIRPSFDERTIQEARLTNSQKICTFLLVASMFTLFIGVFRFGWYIKEISAIFLTGMILAGFAAGWKPGKIADQFLEIGGETMFSMVVIGISNAICLILSDGKIIDSIVHACSVPLQHTSGYISALLMLVVQNFLNFFIPSGPGQAMVSMPIMTALADVTGTSRQVAVLAFQFGDGYSNIFWPTMVCMMCGIMKIPVAKWYRYILKLFGIMFLLQLILICVAVAIGY